MSIAQSPRRAGDSGPVGPLPIAAHGRYTAARSEASHQHGIGAAARQDWFRLGGFGQGLEAAREMLGEQEGLSPAADRAIVGKTAIRWCSLDTTRLTPSE